LPNIFPQQVKSPPKSQAAVALILQKPKGGDPRNEMTSAAQREEDGDAMSGIDKEIL
jgi:hypothetical protein